MGPGNRGTVNVTIPFLLRKHRKNILAQGSCLFGPQPKRAILTPLNSFAVSSARPCISCMSFFPLTKSTMTSSWAWRAAAAAGRERSRPTPCHLFGSQGDSRLLDSPDAAVALLRCINWPRGKQICASNLGCSRFSSPIDAEEWRCLRWLPGSSGRALDWSWDREVLACGSPFGATRFVAPDLGSPPHQRSGFDLILLFPYLLWCFFRVSDDFASVIVDLG